MASEEGQIDEMDSLFEGMVLFNPPSQMADDDHVHVHNHQHQQLQLQEQEQEQQEQEQEQEQPSPSDNTLAGSSSSTSQPLDESLFSDVTLITPLQNQLISPQIQAQPYHPALATTTTTTTTTTTPTTTRSNREVVPSSSSVISRQFSTRKKKRGGLRIGYGRDAPIPDDRPSPPPPSQHAHVRYSESELPPPPSLSFTAKSESESDGSASAPQRQHQQQEEASRCPISDSQPGTATPNTTVENDFSDTTCKQVDSSHSTAASDDDDDDDDANLVSDAHPPPAPTHTPRVLSMDHDQARDDDQVNTTSSSSNSSNASIESRSEQIRAQISQKLSHVRDLVASVSAARKDSTRRRRKAAETVNLASTRYRQLEKELEEACEAEDFETADCLSESLASAEKDKERLAIDLRLAEADCDAVDSKMQEVLEQQIAAEEECASLLKNFAIDAANDSDLVLKNAEVASEKELDGWLSLTEDLELKKMELEIESHLIISARLVLSDSIEHSVEDDRRERELLCKRKEMLRDELEKLLVLVKEKEVEITETDHNIKTVEKRIADVVSSFQEVQSSVDTKHDNLQSGLSQMELHNEALTRKKKEIDDFLSQEKDRGTKLQELAQISADEANMYQEVVELRKSLVLFILKSREEKVRLATTEEKLSQDVHILRQEISAARASLQELSSTKSGFQQEIESLNQRLVFIDKRVPELEAEKKVAATARNFKEAARIATESKALNVEKEGLKIKMAGVVLELGKLEGEICDTVNRLQETEGQISTKEKEVAMARFQRLLLIAGAAKAERSAALELGDLEEADILLAEAEAAESEARKIQPVYNFKEVEFANIPKQYISMELVSNLGGKQLAELAASAAYISPT